MFRQERKRKNGLEKNTIKTARVISFLHRTLTYHRGLYLLLFPTLESLTRTLPLLYRCKSTSSPSLASEQNKHHRVKIPAAKLCINACVLCDGRCLFPQNFELPISLRFLLTSLYLVVASDSRCAFPLTSCVPRLRDSFTAAWLLYLRFI